MDGVNSKPGCMIGRVVVELGVGNEGGGRLDKVGEGDGADDLM